MSDLILSPVLTPGPMTIGALPVSIRIALNMAPVTEGTTLDIIVPVTAWMSA